MRTKCPRSKCANKIEHRETKLTSSAPNERFGHRHHANRAEAEEANRDHDNKNAHQKPVRDWVIGFPPISPQVRPYRNQGGYCKKGIEDEPQRMGSERARNVSVQQGRKCGREATPRTRAVPQDHRRAWGQPQLLMRPVALSTWSKEQPHRRDKDPSQEPQQLPKYLASGRNRLKSVHRAPRMG